MDVNNLWYLIIDSFYIIDYQLYKMKNIKQCRTMSKNITLLKFVNGFKSDN